MLDHILRYLRIYFAIFISASFFGIAVTGISAYHGARASEEQELISRAQTIAYLFEPREIAFLAGDESDLRNPFYASLKRRFADIKDTNSDMRFIYLTGIKKDGTVFFYLDSEPAGSIDNSPPGQEYVEASSIFKEAFTFGRSRFEGPRSDRWGNWISAFVPIRHPGTNEVIAVLGVDISATEYYRRLLSVVSAPALFILLFLIIILVMFREYRKREETLSLKAEFISIASHELRSPLTGISWAIQGLLRKDSIAQSPALKEILISMQRATQSLLDTVAGILDFSRLQHLGQEGLSASSINLSELVRESADALSLFAREKMTSLSISREWPSEALVFGDCEKVKRVINNVVSNAIKYSSSGNEVGIGYQNDGAYHIVKVSNKGYVIKPRDHKKIFSKFFRAGLSFHGIQEASRDSRRQLTFDATEGTGLGLYFAKQIIEAHNGKIWFESSEENGTVFFVAFPVYKKIENNIG